MNRSRKTGKGLPRRVYIKHGSYRFFSPIPIRDPADNKLKKWVTLCHESKDFGGDFIGGCRIVKMMKKSTPTLWPKREGCWSDMKTFFGFYGDEFVYNGHSDNHE